MGHFEVIKRNGEKLLLQSKEPFCTVRSAVQNTSLMGDDNVQLSIISSDVLDLGEGDKIVVFGEEYTIRTRVSREMLSDTHYVYEATFYGVMFELMKSHYRNTDAGGKSTKSTFDLTYSIKDFVKVLIYNVDRDYPGVWTFDEENCPDTDPLTLQFSKQNCLQVLQTLCSKENFNIDFRITQKNGVRTIHIGKFGAKVVPPSGNDYFEWGKGSGLYRLKEDKVDDKAIITRLWVEGGTTNIRSGYRDYSERLQLPFPRRLNKREHALSDGTVIPAGSDMIGIDDDSKRYFEDAELRDRIGSDEDTKEYDKIYPTRTGEVTELVDGDVCAFIDSSMDFDLCEKNDEGTKYLIPDVTAKINFITGKLAGQQFELLANGGYVHASKKFKIIPFTDERGLTIPTEGANDAFRINIGDKYKITDINLPDSYVENAEEDLWYAGYDDFLYMKQARAQYQLFLDRMYFLENLPSDSDTIVFKVGDYVPVRDPRFGIEKNIRIQKVSRNLLLEHDYNLTLSDVTATSIVSKTIIDVIQHNKLIESYKLKDLNKARKGWRTTEELRNMVYDTDGYFDVDNIRPNSIDTNMLTVGSKSQQFVLIDVVFHPNLNGIGNVFFASEGILAHLSINEDGARQWRMGASELSMTNNGGYYLFAKCSKTGDSGVWYLTQNQLKFEIVEDPNNYYFQVGILSSLHEDSFRDFATTYGFTRINGNTITTGKISSSDGECFLDLDGNAFRVGDKDAALAWVGGNLYVKGMMVTVGDKSTMIEDALKENEDNIKAERKAREEALAEERRKRVELEQALEQARQSGAEDVATLTDLLHKANQKLGALEKQVDKEVSNWFYAGAPSATKLPESEWTTNAIKANHINDTYTSIDKSGRYQGKSWRYTTEFKWQEIHDTLVSQALEMASRAQSTADGKSATYLAKPTKYEEGDAWVLESAQTVNGIAYEKGTILYATQSSSAFVQAHWVDKLKYISKSDADKKITASEAKSKQAWEEYAQAKADLAKEQAIADADGKITAEEQARIDAINNAVRTAKSYAEAQDALLKTQQEAYADGKVSEAERNAIAVANARAQLAETNAKAYADGIVDEEERARIAAAQKAYEDAVAKAKEMDDNVKIGDRNLLLNSGVAVTNSSYDIARYLLSPAAQNLKDGELVTLVIKGSLGERKTSFDIYNSGGNIHIYGLKIKRSSIDEDGIAYVTGAWRKTDDTGQNTQLIIFAASRSVTAESEIDWVKLVRGNKTSKDWTEAPEDVEARYQKLIASVDIEFALSASVTVAPTSGWVTTAPAPQSGKYMWQRTKTTLKDGTTDIKGVTCIQGADGRSIESINEQYYHSTSMTSLQGGSWSNTAPTPADGKWIWTRSVTRYTIGADTITSPICVTGQKGEQGLAVRPNLLTHKRIGDKSWIWTPEVTKGQYTITSKADGKIVVTGGAGCTDDYNARGGGYAYLVISGDPSEDKSSSDVYVMSAKIRIASGKAYVLSFGNGGAIKKSNTYNVDATTTPLDMYCVYKASQDVAKGMYFYMTTGSVLEVYDIKLEKFSDGEQELPTAYIPHHDDLKGDQGIPGAKGADGKTSYTHIAYADTASGGGFSQSPTGKAYIGMYVDFVQADSSDPNKYAWSLIKGEKGQDAINFDMGRMVHPDPTFTEGYNKIYKYDNANQGAVTVTRIARPEDCPSTSSHALQMHFDSTIASVSPGIGGFYQYTKSRANAIFVHRFIANVPAGYKLNWTGNSIGVGGRHKWVTPNVGTGKYEEYICVTYCGSSGTFSDFGHIYLTGARATMDVIIAYSTMYDMTDAPDYYAKIAEAKQATADLKAYTDGAFADGIISKTEAQAIATYKQQVNESWTSGFAEYERVYANQLLSGTPKTSLLNAKVNLAGAKDALLSSIDTAIADGKATSVEVSNVDGKYNAYNTALSSYQKALEDAREAIRKGGHEIIDTRNDNQPPSWYRTNYKKTTVREFKFQSVIGIPVDWRNGYYCTLETTVNYSDKSGGRVTQKAILNNSVELQRVGTADDAAWEPWNNISAKLSNVDELLQALKSGELEQFPDLKYLTDAFQKYSASVTGILFAKVMALSNSVNRITAYLNGDSTSNIAMLKAGLQNPFTVNETEKVAINHDGSGHFDTLHFGSGVLDFMTRGSGSKSILRVGEGTMSRTLTEIINGNSVEGYTPATIGNISLNNVSKVHDIPFTVANDGTVVRVKCTLNAFAQSLPSGGDVLSSSGSASVTAEIVGVKELARAWQNIMMPPDGIGSPVTSGSGQVSHDSTMYLNKGSYILRFSLVGSGNGWAKSNSIHQRWSSNERFNAISEKGVRFYGGPKKYVDLNYALPVNLATLQIRGGLDVDYIETSGAVLCGGQVTANGVVEASFGKYSNKNGISEVQVGKLGSGTSCYFRVYHSIGSTNYIPYVTAVGATYNDLPQIVFKSYNYFDVRFYNGSSQSYHNAFNYICHKSD